MKFHYHFLKEIILLQHLLSFYMKKKSVNSVVKKKSPKSYPNILQFISLTFIAFSLSISSLFVVACR